MQMNKAEIQNLDKAITEAREAAVVELQELQLALVGGGCEVSFN